MKKLTLSLITIIILSSSINLKPIILKNSTESNVWVRPWYSTKQDPNLCRLGKSTSLSPQATTEIEDSLDNSPLSYIKIYNSTGRALLTYAKIPEEATICQIEAITKSKEKTFPISYDAVDDYDQDLNN